MATLSTPSPRRRTRPSALLLGLALAACHPESSTKSGQPAPEASAAPANAAALPQAAGERPATAGALELPSEAYVTQPTFVRHAASEAREVEVPGSKRRQANWMATLQRGEHVRVLQVNEGWLRVQSSDEAAGWIKREGVLVGPEVAQATNLAPLQRFTRPDLLALVAGKAIEPGSLLFVLRRKEGFTLVNYAGNAVGWVLTDALERDANEVEAAKLLHRARQLAERHDATAEALFALARQRFAATRLVAATFPPPTAVPVAEGVTSAGVAPEVEDMGAGAATPDGGRTPGGATGPSTAPPPAGAAPSGGAAAPDDGPG